MSNDDEQRIRDHYVDPYHRGWSDHVTHFGESRNEQCERRGTESDVVEVALRISDERIAEAWFDGDGCELSQAIASMLVEHVESQDVDDMVALTLEKMTERLQLNVDVANNDCGVLALEALQRALKMPVDENPDAPTFGGPDLGDEC